MFIAVLAPLVGWIAIPCILYYAIVMLKKSFNKRDTLNIRDAVKEKGKENKTL